LRLRLRLRRACACVRVRVCARACGAHARVCARTRACVCGRALRAHVCAHARVCVLARVCAALPPTHSLSAGPLSAGPLLAGPLPAGPLCAGALGKPSQGRPHVCTPGVRRALVRLLRETELDLRDDHERVRGARAPAHTPARSVSERKRRSKSLDVWLTRSTSIPLRNSFCFAGTESSKSKSTVRHGTGARREMAVRAGRAGAHIGLQTAATRRASRWPASMQRPGRLTRLG